MKYFAQRMMRRMGLEVRRSTFTRNVMDFVTDRQIDVVLDVGANVGQFAESLRGKGYRGKIVSFEPVSEEYQALAAKAAADANWNVNNFALGDRAETAEINVSESSVFNSLLPVTDAAVRFTETAAPLRTETIEVRTLDDVFPTAPGNTLLKIDTQGYEQQVLQGGRHLLPMMKGVLMELPIIHLYEATWQFHEAVAFMEEAGFIPAQIHPVNYHPTDSMSLIEVDCLFRPRDSRLD